MSAHRPSAEPTFGPLALRGLAFTFDLILVTVLVVGIGYAVIALDLPVPAWMGWIFYIVAGLYLGLLPATSLEATPGKRMVGLRICDGAGKRIGVLRAVVRLVAFVPSIGLAFAGFLLAAFTPRRQALHDLVAGTFVVNRGATSEQIAQVPAPVPMSTRIGLVVGLGLFAFAAHSLWVALDGRNRHDEAIELMTATYPYKAAVEKALRSGAPMPAPAALPRQARAMSARPDGTIVIEVSDNLAPGARITLRPDAVPNGEYLWTCRAEGIRYVPVACRP